jgi:ribosomal protein L3 glutamine methyltransferase
VTLYAGARANLIKRISFNKVQLFFGHGTNNVIDESIVLVSHALHLPPEIPDILWHTRLTYPEKQTVLDLFNQRVQL